MSFANLIELNVLFLLYFVFFFSLSNCMYIGAIHKQLHMSVRFLISVEGRGDNLFIALAKYNKSKFI